MKKVGLLCGREYSFPPAFIVRVNQLGKPDGVAAEFVKLGGTSMNEPAEYSVIVDRISHEVEYYRGYLKHAVLQGTYVINNPFWWTADDKYFNYSVAAKLGIAIPKTVLLPQKGYPSDVDITSESLHNLEYPMNWDGLLDYVGRPAILKPFSGGGWKHVYKVNNKEELLAAYDKTSPYCMTLQEFIDFTQYVRCFTFGKTDILPVHYDPKERKYIVDHEYLTTELGARIVKDGQTINQALGYEMNTIEFAVKDGVPYAIDFLNPAPDFERDRITEFYFAHVVEKIADLGERVASAALDDKDLFAQLHLREEEERLARIPTGYGRASTASRLDAFLLPDSLKFAEYNGESPAGAGYAETLAEIFRALPMMARFSKHYDVHSYPLSAKLLDALVMSYVDWGGTSKRPQIAIVDWREVPTWSEFEILKERFEKMGVPVVLADPRDLVFDGKTRGSAR